MIPRVLTNAQIAYTQNLLSAVEANMNVDRTRVYAVGFSPGGGLANLLACTPATAGVFAAYATSSPALYNGTLASSSACSTGGHPIALIDFHGLADGQIVRRMGGCARVCAG
jgi:poly(3-hydroxybutyrate) depolymerase